MALGEKTMAIGESSKAAQAREGKKFPVGMRIVAVDDDHICLAMLNKLLIKCQYQVTCFTDAIEALKMIKENKDEIDLVVTDVHMPHIDGFQLLEIVGLELDLPVIMLSANDSKETVMKGVMHGACDYLIKPVRIEELSVIWKHVARRKPLEEFYEDAMNNDDEAMGENNDQRRQMDIHGDNSDKSTGKRSKDDPDEDDFDDMESNEKSTKKKPRVVWSPDLHKKFVDAVSDIGVDKAVPKSILEKMKMEDLTRENVASHLQKYRLYLKRLNADPNSFQGAFSSGSFSINLRSFQRFKNFHSHGRYRVVSRDAFPLLQSSMPSNTPAMPNMAPSQMTQIGSGTGFNNAGTSNFMLTNSTMNNNQMNQSGTSSYPVTSNSNYFAPFNNNPNYLSLSTLYPALGPVPFMPFGYPMTNVPPISNPNSMVGPIFGARASENEGGFNFETGVGQQQLISSFNTSWSVANANIHGNLNDINYSNLDYFFNNPINGYPAMTSGSTETGIISSGIGMSIVSGDMGTGIASGDIGTGIVSGGMSSNVSGGMGFDPVNEGTETGDVNSGKGTDVVCSNIGISFGGSDMKTSVASGGMGTDMGTGGVDGGIGTGPASQGDAEFVGSFHAADSATDNNSSSSLHVVDEVSISGLDEFLATLQTSDGDGDGDSDGVDSLPFMNNGFFN